MLSRRANVAIKLAIEHWLGRLPEQISIATNGFSSAELAQMVRARPVNRYN
jgi:hypothetical protein